MSNSFLNPCTLKISFKLYSQSATQFLWRWFGEFGIGFATNPHIENFLFSHHLSAWYSIGIVRKNYVLVPLGSWRVKSNKQKISLWIDSRKTSRFLDLSFLNCRKLILCFCFKKGLKEQNIFAFFFGLNCTFIKKMRETRGKKIKIMFPNQFAHVAHKHRQIKSEQI